MLIRLILLLFLFALIVFIVSVLSSVKYTPPTRRASPSIAQHVAGVGLIVLSGLFIMPLLLQWFLEPTSEPALGVLGFFIASAAFGVFLVISNYRQRLKAEKQSATSTLFRLIRQHGDRITATEVALNSALRVEAAEAELSKLCRQGYGEVKLGEDGERIYIFHATTPEE